MYKMQQGIHTVKLRRSDSRRGSQWGYFISLDSTFSNYSPFRKKDNLAIGEQAALSIPTNDTPETLSFSFSSWSRLIFRIYHPGGNDVSLEISMTVGVYGYRLTMEIKHFRAPREMHTFPLATRENPPSRSLAIPSRHQLSTNSQQPADTTFD